MVKPLAAAAFLAALVIATSAEAAATLTCPYQGKQVQVVITNSKDGPRSCNAVCVWSYAKVPLRGQGGAALESGESKSVYHSTAPVNVDGLVTSDLNCNR